MNFYNFLSFIIIPSFVKYAGSTFPKCEEILTNEGGDKPQCVYCGTPRIKESCQELCKSSGCDKKYTETSESSSSSNSKSSFSSKNESKSESEQKSSSSSSTNSTNGDEESGSGKHGKGKRGKKGAKKAKGHKKKKHKDSSSSSSNQGSQSSSNTKESSSSSSSNQQSSPSSSNNESSSSSSNSGSSNSNSESSINSGSSSSNSGSSNSDSGSSSNSGSSSGNSGSSNSDGGSSSNSGSSGNVKVSSTCNDIDPCVPIDEANKKYQERCKAEGLNHKCAKNCQYDAAFSKLKKAFLSHECEISEARQFLYAASNRKNNIKCCQEKGVLDGNRAGVCDCFCNPGCEQWTGKAEAKYLRCLSQFDNIMTCHWASSRPG